MDSIMKKCTKAQREDFERLKNMLFDGNKLPPTFWELIYKKNWVKSVEILEERMSRVRYSEKRGKDLVCLFTKSL